MLCVLYRAHTQSSKTFGNFMTLKSTVLDFIRFSDLHLNVDLKQHLTTNLNSVLLLNKLNIHSVNEVQERGFYSSYRVHKSIRL